MYMKIKIIKKNQDMIYLVDALVCASYDVAFLYFATQLSIH